MTSIPRPSAQIGPNKFRFLNEEHEIQTWNEAGISKLWLYNLHYFDHCTFDLIERWIADNPIGFGNGWEPYPIAIRIVNWIKWALNGGQLSKSAIRSLQLQAEYLSQTIEHHLGANHLFANAVGLTMAGLFFEGQPPKQWLRVGVPLLRRELREQVLSDGGHFERSPMYHALILESLLDLINAAQVHGRAADQRCVWSENARKMLAWLLNMAHPDGQIAFFNDSAFGIAPGPEELTHYASRLALEPADLPLGTSGYVRLGSEGALVLFDAGAIGPGHQPGHAHADTLSFEMSLSGHRVLVNSGTSTYEKGPDRQRQRGTASHNTIRIDGVDQSEVWNCFRVARRARPLDVRTDGRTFVEAAHDGYRRLSSPVLHRRRLELRASEVVITDSIEGRGRHRIEAFFHFHPEAKSNIHLDAKLIARTEDSFWYPQFNISVPNTRIVGSWIGQCPVQFTSVIPLS